MLRRLQSDCKVTNATNFEFWVVKRAFESSPCPSEKNIRNIKPYYTSSHNRKAIIRYILDSQRRYFLIAESSLRTRWLTAKRRRAMTCKLFSHSAVIGAKLLRFIPVFQPNWTRSWFISSFKLWPLRRNVRYHPKIPKVGVIFVNCK